MHHNHMCAGLLVCVCVGVWSCVAGKWFHCSTPGTTLGSSAPCTPPPAVKWVSRVKEEASTPSPPSDRVPSLVPSAHTCTHTYTYTCRYTRTHTHTLLMKRWSETEEGVGACIPICREHLSSVTIELSLFR